jgi:hypothetical protein
MLSRWIASTVSIFGLGGLVNWNMEELQNVGKTKGKQDRYPNNNGTERKDPPSSCIWMSKVL